MHKMCECIIFDNYLLIDFVVPWSLKSIRNFDNANKTQKLSLDCKNKIKVLIEID